MKKRTGARAWFALASLALIASTAGWLRDGNADGIAATDPLYYTGNLQESGMPITGARAITLILWNSETETASSSNKCQTTVPTAPVTKGRFRIALDPACIVEIKANPDLWIEVIVGATSLGRKKLGAVPYAVEAQRASDASGALKTRVDGFANKTEIPIHTAWVAYTPAFHRDGGTELANTTSTGRWRRVGDSIQLRIRTRFTGAPASGGSWYAWSLPTGLSIDYAKTTLNGAGAVIGGGFASQAGNNNAALSMYTRGTTTVSASPQGVTSPYINDNSPWVWGNTAVIELYGEVPIAGWSVTQ
jgi:hypothetical protein